MGLLISKLVKFWRRNIGHMDVAVVDAEVPPGTDTHIEPPSSAVTNASIQSLHSDENTPLLASQSSQATPTTTIGDNPAVQTEIPPSSSSSTRPVIDPMLHFCRCDRGRFHSVEAHTQCPEEPCGRHGKARHTHTPRQFLDWAKILLTRDWAGDLNNKATRSVQALYMVPFVFNEQKRVLLRLDPGTRGWGPPGISWEGELLDPSLRTVRPGRRPKTQSIYEVLAQGMAETVSYAGRHGIRRENLVIVRTLDYDMAAWHTMGQPLAGHKNRRGRQSGCNLPTVPEDEVQNIESPKRVRAEESRLLVQYTVYACVLIMIRQEAVPHIVPSTSDRGAQFRWFGREDLPGLGPLGLPELRVVLLRAFQMMLCPVHGA
ncbi:hypothetical protein BDV97DRAFT_352462 [Delphinella strobiligena]|nr:hypothetical protein BDV97DRAFT_352462 [Delphinella strobiligena]